MSRCALQGQGRHFPPNKIQTCYPHVCNRIKQLQQKHSVITLLAVYSVLYIIYIIYKYYSELICKAALFFNHRCEAVVIQMSRCHTKSKKALSADATKDSWRSIFTLSAVGDKQLAAVSSLLLPPRVPADCP